MFDEKTKYPLTWPDDWPRTNPSSRAYSRFGERTVNVAFSALAKEMRRLTEADWLMSSNIPRTRQGDGPPASTYKQPTDPGVAVYFAINKKPISLACDKWIRVEDNIWALAKHIEALRGQDRWGVGTIEQAFRGYMALPGIGQSGGSKWWETLGVSINASAEQVKEAYRILVKKHHPDRNGDAELFHRIQEAFNQFEQIGK